MQNGQMSVSDQIGLTLGVLLLFSIIATVVGYIAADETRQKLALFASEPVVVDGTVTGKRLDIVRPTQGAIHVYWLDVAFKNEAGVARTASVEVANTLYDRYHEGAPVKVTYARSKPEWLFIPGAEPTVRDAGMMDGMFEYGAMGIAVFLVGLLAWYFTRDDGTTQAMRLR